MRINLDGRLGLYQLCERIRVKHYSIRAEQVDVDWVKRFILFHGERHPKDMGVTVVEAFQTHLAMCSESSRGCCLAMSHNRAGESPVVDESGYLWVAKK